MRKLATQKTSFRSAAVMATLRTAHLSCAGCGEDASQDLGANPRTRRRAALAAQSGSSTRSGEVRVAARKQVSWTTRTDCPQRLHAALDELEIEQVTSTPRISVWGNFALTQTDDEHPITRRVHIAFIAPTRVHVGGFRRAAVQAGLTDDGPPGSRPDYGDDYFTARVRDPAGNSFEAVHRLGQRPRGDIDHAAVRSPTAAPTLARARG